MKKLEENVVELKKDKEDKKLKDPKLQAEPGPEVI